MFVMMDLVRDLKELNASELASLGGHAPTRSDGLAVYAELAERRMRGVPSIQYQVLKSKELQRNPLYPQVAKVLKEIQRKLERGKSIAMYLPDYERPGRKSRDPMLNHWDIRHLHLSAQETLRENGLVARSDFLLYFRLAKNDIYWIDIGRHQGPDSEKWLKVGLLNIIQHNWPHTQHLSRNIIVDEPDVNSFDLGRKHNFNVFAAYKRRLMMSPLMGVMTDGTPMALTMQYQRFTHDLRVIEHNIRTRPYEFGVPPHLAYAHVKLEHWDEAHIFCKELRTGLQIPFHWEST